ncbi:hypothetical protein ACO2Q7_14480 [Rathayibacter sp. KR2-224]|uniref:hypothetical protein n=1 Tax=Rathayibacter sp. KR2-224 TaxID=3400913 RepID=UPI003C056C59
MREEPTDEAPVETPPAAPGSRRASTGARVMRFTTNLFATEATVYGIVLVTALTAVGWKFDTDLEVLAFIVGTTLIFWLTHVYARTVVAPSGAPGHPAPVRRALGEALRHSNGMLIAMLLPALFLLLAALHVLDEYVAYFIALAIGIVLLMLIGYLVAYRNRRPWWRRILSAIVTGLLGVVVIVLGVIVH